MHWLEFDLCQTVVKDFKDNTRDHTHMPYILKELGSLQICHFFADSIVFKQ